MTREEALQHYRQAEQLFKAGNYRDALGRLDEVNRAFSDNRNILYYRAMCLARLGKTSQAGTICDHLSSALGDPRGVQLKRQLGTQLFPEWTPAAVGTGGPAVQAPGEDTRKRGPFRRLAQAATGALAAIFLMPRKAADAVRDIGATPGKPGPIEGSKGVVAQAEESPAAGKTGEIIRKTWLSRRTAYGMFAGIATISAGLLYLLLHQPPPPALPGPRTFTLPDKGGRALYARDWGSHGPWQRLKPEKDVISVPAGKEVVLEVGSPDAFPKEIPPETVDGFRLGPGFADDDVLKIAKPGTLHSIYVEDPGGYGHGAHVTDQGLARLAAIKSLRVLDFSAGATRITDAGLAHLAELPMLEELGLSRAAITEEGTKRLGTLRRLRRLDLSFTPVTDASLEPIASLRKLESLNLVGTGITDAGLQHVARLKNLRELELGSTAITENGLSHVAKLGKLESLNLSNRPITDAGLEPLAAMTSLRALDLSRTRITDAGLQRLAALNSLRRLNLSETTVSDAGIAHLTALKDLQTLALGRETVSMNVTDASIPSLRSLRSLANLDVMGTQVSKKGVEELKAALPACTIVGEWNRPEPGMRVLAFPVEKALGDVYACDSAEGAPFAWQYAGRAQGSLSVKKESILRLDATAEAVSDFRSVLNANLTDLHTLAIPGLVVGDGVLSGLESVQGLRCLMMPFVKVAPSTKERIGKLVTLQELDLGHADIGNDDLKLINSLTELRTLRLAGNQITEAGVAHLGDLVKLQELDLASNPIEDGAVQYLQKLSGLKRLYLEGTKVSDAAVASLQGILPECLITHTLTAPQSEPLRYPARTMKFPNRSVGTLRTRPAGSQDEWSVFGEAKGEASIPENQEVMLELADGAESSMPDIAKLGAEGPDVLDARNATVTDDALNQVSNMASLYALYISDQHYGRGTNVTAEGLRALEKLPKLAALKAGGRIGYSEEAFSTLGAIPTLKQLDLTGADWAGPCLAYLRGLPGLSELKVSGRMLNDIDLHHVAALSSLRTLQIDNMAVSAAGLAHLRAATQLQAVNLSGAWWNSPDMDLRHMAALPNLKQFKLTGVNVSEKGAAAIAQSQSIEDLQLVHGRLSDKSVAPLANLRSLRRLDLSQNQFIVGNCLAALAGLPSLESLSLDATRLTDDALLALISMTSLRELDVRITGLTLKGFQQLAKVPSLESLACDKVTDEMLNEICLLQRLKKLNMDSDWIRRFTDQGASCLGNLRQIEELSLGYAGLTSEGLASLANLGSLRVLGLKGCQDIGDKGLKHLEGLQNLRRLDLTSTGVTQEGLSVLREKLPLCEITTSDHMARTVHFPQDRSLGKVGKGHPYLVLRNFEKAFSEAAPAQGDVAVPVDQVACLAISQEAAKDLSPLATLNASDVHAIVLKDVPIDGKQLSHLGTLTDLRSLDLANTGVADKDLAFLDKLNALEMLDLSNTLISNSTLKRLADRSSLRQLRLRGTDVDDGAVPMLEHLHVGELDVTDTLITEEGANILKKALGEHTVKHSMAKGPHVRPVRSATDTASAVSPASSPNTSPEPPQAKPVQTLEKRILRFPRGTVVGVLYLRDAGAPSEQPWTRVSYVMGNVNVPAGKEARLKLEVEVASTLAKLAPDDLQALDLTGLKSRGDDWRQVKRLTGLNLLVLTDTGASDAVIKDLRRSLPKCVIVP